MNLSRQVGNYLSSNIKILVNDCEEKQKKRKNFTEMHRRAKTESKHNS